MKRNSLIILGLLWLAAHVTAAHVFEENWDSGKIDKSRWTVKTDAAAALELVKISAGDYALALHGEQAKGQVHIYSTQAISREDGLGCEFKIWTGERAKEISFYGPWHHTNFFEGLGSFRNSTLDAGIYVSGQKTLAAKWAEAGDVTMDFPGPGLQKEFLAALQAADSKANAVLVRVEMGKTTGGCGAYSTDGGKTWNALKTDKGKAIDTRAMGAVEYWEGLKIGSHRYNLVGFVADGATVFIDDVVVRDKDGQIATGPVITPIPNAKDLVSAEMLMPKGEWIEREMPATLDLADRARLMVHGLTSFVNPQQGYVTYGQGYFNVNPAYMTQINGSEGHCCWSKTMESLAKARVMSGSDENLKLQETMLDNLLAKANVINPTAQSPWLPRSMITLNFIYQMHPTPELKKLLDSWTAYQAKMVHEEGDMAYFDNSKGSIEATMLGVLGFWRVAFIQGTMIRALSNWHQISGNPQSLELAGKIKNFVVQPQFWQSETDPRVVVSAERAHYMGHHHSFTTALMGLLWYAEQAKDTRLLEFARDGYEYMRNFGLARIGLFAEMCTTGDMAHLALKLSDLGVGDYWNDADCYIRNQLTENQVTDAARLQAAVDQMPKNDRKMDPYFETDDKVAERNVGCYLSDASNPTLVRERTMVWTACCNGNCVPAVYYAWESIVRFKDGAAQVNLLLNRVSPWLDVDSYLPYEGKVVISNKQAKCIGVRMPRWVELDKVKATAGGRALKGRWLDRNLLLDGVKPGMKITITFPMKQTTETYTLKWKESDFWYESTNPGWEWKPDPKPTKFTMTFKGNTLVDISPRSTAKGYKLYLRDELRDSNKAPIHKMRRFITADWPRQN